MENSVPPQTSSSSGVAIRLLEEPELDAADRIMRTAFGTFIGLPEPAAFLGDADYVRSRWRSNPASAFAAEAEGQVVGSNFASNWGSVGFFGPLTVDPSMWDRSVGSRLMEPVLACFAQWGTAHAGLFTFAHSQKHHGLYQKFGFWPQFLTMIMAKPVGSATRNASWRTFSELPEDERNGALLGCRQLTHAIFDGLDLSLEMQAVHRHGLGETLLLEDDGGIAGIAVCHCGPGTEAGSGTCYIKFGAVRPGPAAARDFDRLLDACEAMAAGKGLTKLLAGVNTARHEAYRQMLARGFRIERQGVAMQRHNQAGYNRPGVYLIDDWR